jgi:hypothetical protein
MLICSLDSCFGTVLKYILFNGTVQVGNTYAFAFSVWNFQHAFETVFRFGLQGKNLRTQVFQNLV